MQQKQITIGLPCFNAETTILKAVDSVIKQTYENWHLIIIDDNSSDNSIKEIKKVEDERISLYKNEKNLGLGKTLNKIIGLTTTKYFARMDADDIMHPNRLKEQIEYLDKNSDVDLLGTGIICINEHEEVLGRRCPPQIIKSAYQVFKGEIIYHPTLIGKSEWFKKNNYDETFIRSEDFELWCRTAGEANIHNLPSHLLYYREHKNNTTLKKYLLQSKISRNIILKYGIRKIGIIRTYYLFMRRVLKDFIYILFYLFGAWDKIISKRN